MALLKKGGYWHYDFWFQKHHYQGSTFQKNIEKARQVVATVRSNAGLAVFGIAPPKVSPLFKDFVEKETGEFSKYVAQHNKAKPRTIAFYAEKIRRLLEFKPFADARLSAINEHLIEKYKQVRAEQDRKSRGKGKIAAGAINAELRTLRKVLNLAYEFQLLARVPKIHMLPGEVTRDYVLDGETEKRYLAVAVYPLKEAATLLLDLGLRPDELVSAKKTDVVGKTFYVRDGKTGARQIPIPPRSVNTLKYMFELWPESPWIFPGQRKGRHLTTWALGNLHAGIRDAEDSGFEKAFVLYSLRHTFGTRLAESGASVFTIKNVMGHSSVKTSEKYIHLRPESIERDMARKAALDTMIRGDAEAVPEILESQPSEVE